MLWACGGSYGVLKVLSVYFGLSSHFSLVLSLSMYIYVYIFL